MKGNIEPAHHSREQGNCIKFRNYSVLLRITPYYAKDEGGRMKDESKPWHRHSMGEFILHPSILIGCG